jgi:NAD(P)-dependent dehydrogenase (short-subunit alcohol dehydrogenase family)
MPPKSLFSLRGKRCVISGASRGIGLAIAKLFASQGAGCTLIGRHEESLATAVKSLKDINERILPHTSSAFDVSDAGGWHALMRNLKAVSKSQP